MFNNSVFYLKYRPQSLDELIGQETVKKTLLSSFQNNKLSHAYLFVGPRGTGKTSTARILAKMVNCENSFFANRDSLTNSDKRTAINDVPCNKCPTCISITDGSNLDLIEIDAASNRGIEDIRLLRDKIKLVPTNSKKKVYIIDEVHMLTTEAFNALLKTLEEPPSHALFILATTESAKIPKTILSRAQRLDFKLAAAEEISQALTKIITKEKIEIEDEALKILISRADGSFRDGVKLLDQVSFQNGKITAKSLEDTLKSTQFEDLINLIKSLAEKNTNQSLLNLVKQIENGADVKELMLSLMDILRKLVFIKNGLGEQLVKLAFTKEKYEELVKTAESFTNQILISNLNILQEALEKLKFASIPSLPIELAIVEICGEQKLDVRSESNDQTSSIQSQNPVSNLQHLTSNDDILKLKEKWTFVLETIRPFNFSLEALLRSIKIAECSESSVIMEVPYSFHQRILEAPKNKDLLESIFSDILGRSIRVSTILGNRPKVREDIANIEVADDDEIIRAAAEIFNSDSVN